MAKEIQVPVDDAAYDALAEEAERAGVTVQELAGRVLTHDAARRRFMSAAGHYIAAWGPAFDEAFGTAAAGGAAA
ncbi:hypothetical protein [Streptomyces sp. NPDC056683]|uniref:hypothetical protein n=1 Tax=Streptomyces sp. NPDC056683 TaxID=3345910 RepID=UPI003684D4A5